MIVGVTGHRPHKLDGGYDEPLRSPIIAAVKAVLVRVKATRGITGMALGADQYFAQACIELEIPFTAAVPFQGQASRWPFESQRHYYELLGQADEVVYVSDPGYARWKLDARNHWVVNHCALLLAVWNGSPGGSANTVLFANTVRRDVEIINPRELKHAEQTAGARRPSLVAPRTDAHVRQQGEGAGDA
jgi:uncharacterized phage-like protein YoqJ